MPTNDCAGTKPHLPYLFLSFSTWHITPDIYNLNTHHRDSLDPTLNVALLFPTVGLSLKALSAKPVRKTYRQNHSAFYQRARSHPIRHLKSSSMSDMLGTDDLYFDFWQRINFRYSS